MMSRPWGGGKYKGFVKIVIKPLSTKKLYDGVGGVKNCPKMRDVIYGRPP